MIGIFNNMMNSKYKEVMPLDTLEYMTSILTTSGAHAPFSDKTRANLLDVAKKVRDIIYFHSSLPLKSKREALIALNKVKVYALAGGTPEDYKLFLQLDRITSDLKPS